MLDNITQIGLRIKEEREKQGYKQQAFAEKIKIDKCTLNRYEKGVQSPSLENIVTVAQGLGVSIDYLVFGQGNASVNKIKNIEQSNLYKSFRAMATLIEYGLVTVDENEEIDTLVLNLKKNPLLIGFFDEITNLCRCKNRFDSNEFEKAIQNAILEFESAALEQSAIEMNYADFNYKTNQDILYEEIFKSVQNKNKRNSN